VIPVLIHGDPPSRPGRGGETLNLSQLEGYRRAARSISSSHQIGFHNRPRGPLLAYSTGRRPHRAGPIFHVNGDDPEAAVRAVRSPSTTAQPLQQGRGHRMFATAARHNEADDPSYTQPILYRKIKDTLGGHPLCRRLVRRGSPAEEGTG